MNGTYKARLTTAVRDIGLHAFPEHVRCNVHTIFSVIPVENFRFGLFSGRKLPSGNFDITFRLSRPLTDLCTKVGKHCQFSHVNGKQPLTADKSLRLQVKITCNIVATC